MKSLLFTVLCLLLACLASAAVIESVHEYSDASCNTEIAVVYYALESSQTCDSTVPCLESPTNSSVAASSIKCLSSLPAQPANTIRLGVYFNENCDFSKQDGSLITEAKLGKGGCVNGTYYTCSGGSYSTYTCSDSQCNNNCKTDPDDPTCGVGKCQGIFGLSAKVTCTGSSSSASALSLSYFFILAVLIGMFAF